MSSKLRKNEAKMGRTSREKDKGWTEKERKTKEMGRLHQ